MTLFVRLLFGVLLGCAGMAGAANEDKVEKVIQDTLARQFPSLKVTQIKPTVITGLYQVSAGPVLLYMSADGRYIFDGDIYDIQANNQNMTEIERQTSRKSVFASILDKEVIWYKAKNQKHVVTVFTDIDCGYCRRFHRQVKDLNAQGVSVRYLAFPRSAAGTPSYEKMVSVWCSETPAAALTKAKEGEVIPVKQCDNPVQKQFELGARMGVQGTPSLILEDGTLIPGYVPTDKLLEMLNHKGTK